MKPVLVNMMFNFFNFMTNSKLELCKLIIMVLKLIQRVSVKIAFRPKVYKANLGFWMFCSHCLSISLKFYKQFLVEILFLY